MSAQLDEESCVYYCLYCGPCLSLRISESSDQRVQVHRKTYHPENADFSEDDVMH